MFIVKNKIGKRLINWLETSSAFNRHFVVLTWDKSYVIRRTKPNEELVKTEITPDNILTLQFKYHSSFSVLKEYVAEVDKLDYDNQKLYLNIWTNEQKTNLIKQTVLDLTPQTNETLKRMLDTKVFNEKYGDNYNYFITLYLNPDIISATDDNRRFSEVTLKYSLKSDYKKTEMRLKSKFDISKDEAKNLSSMISYWDK